MCALVLALHSLSVGGSAGRKRMTKQKKKVKFADNYGLPLVQVQLLKVGNTLSSNSDPCRFIVT